MNDIKIDNTIKIDVVKQVSTLYNKLVQRAIEFDFDELILKGGRSSIKSTVILFIVIMMVLIFKRSGIVIVRYNNAVNDRLMKPIKKIMRRCRILHLFTENKTAHEFRLIGYNGVVIKCIGCDDPDNVKSMADEMEESYCVVAFEELNTFKSLDDVMNIKATFIRGKDKQIMLAAFNPKRVQNDWCNNEFDKHCGKALGYKTNVYIETYHSKVEVVVNGETVKVEGDIKRVIFHSTIYDLIEHGFTDVVASSLRDAERMKSQNETTWKWMWLGANVPIPGLRVFGNIVEWDGTKEDCFNKLGLDVVYRGLDFGQGQHYTAYVEVMFDRVNMDVYIVKEYGEIGKEYGKFCEEVRKINNNNFPIKCDYATVIPREQCEKYGLNLEDCYKPERIWRYDYFSGTIRHIYINPDECPMSYKTWSQAEYKLNAKGEITSEPGKENDDFIDSGMYSMSDEMRNAT